MLSVFGAIKNQSTYFVYYDPEFLDVFRCFAETKKELVQLTLGWNDAGSFEVPKPSQVRLPHGWLLRPCN